MKKSISVFVLIFLILPWFAMAANPCGGGNAAGDVTALPKCINQIYIWSLGIGTLLALLMMIAGGYLYMTASGNAEQTTKGVEFIWSSVIGLGLLFCVFILLSTINPELVSFNLTKGLCYNNQTKAQIVATSKADCESKTGKWFSVFEKVTFSLSSSSASNSSRATLFSSQSTDLDNMKRVLAKDQQQMSRALAAGCIQDGNVPGSTAFECPDNAVSALSLTAGTRVIARTPDEISNAKKKGCVTTVTDAAFQALECPTSVAESLGLPEDKIVYPFDTAANEQVGANMIHSFGNTGRGVKVAILDTGIDYNHPELRSSYIGGYNFVDRNNDPMDEYSHGTHLAGIISADGVNPQAKGIAPDAQIMAFKVLNDNGKNARFGWSSVVAVAIRMAHEAGAQVINMSFGNDDERSSVTCDSYEPAVTDIIRYVTERGTNVVIASGNQGSNVAWPACIDAAIAVGAVDSSDVVASFSGRGGALDITAPGVGIFSSIPNNSYATHSGTSMAAPMVVGVLALIRSAHPEFSAKQAEELLFSSAKDLGDPGKDPIYGWGRIDVAKALKVVALTPSADLKINDSDGPVSADRGAFVNITLTSSNVSSCAISPIGWNNKTNGSTTYGPIEKSETVSVICNGPNGEATDSVEIKSVGAVNTLVLGQSLTPGQSIVSNNEKFFLIYQSDGNLVLYERFPDYNRAYWDSGTGGSGLGFAVMQGDGNFVIYQSDGNPLWSTQTGGNSGAILGLQDDGHLVVYRNEMIFWYVGPEGNNGSGNGTGEGFERNSREGNDNNIAN